MIIWMPYVAPGATAQSLTDDHLHDQIESAEALLDLLERRTTDENHQHWHATQMWTGYEYSLCVHGLMMATELASVREREIDSGSAAYLVRIGRELEETPGIEKGSPPWLGDLDVHRSHRSNLIMKNPEYAQKWEGVPLKMPLLWPQVVERDPRGYRLRLGTSDRLKLRHGSRKLPEWLRYDENRQEVVSA